MSVEERVQVLPADGLEPLRLCELPSNDQYTKGNKMQASLDQLALRLFMNDMASSRRSTPVAELRGRHSLAEAFIGAAVDFTLSLHQKLTRH